MGDSQLDLAPATNPARQSRILAGAKAVVFSSSSKSSITTDPGAIPRTSIHADPNLHFGGSGEVSEAKAKLELELGVSGDAIFADLALLIRHFSSKMSGIDASALTFQAQTSKIITKLQKSIVSLPQETPEIHRETLYAIYGNLLQLASEFKGLVATVEVLDELRLQLNVQLAIPESSFDRIVGAKVPQDISRLSHSVSGMSISINSLRNSMMGGEGMGDSRVSMMEQKAPINNPSPLKLFAKVPQEITDSGLEKPELMRLSAVYELIETEFDYVNDLQTMIGFHKVQLLLIASEAEVNGIFSNIEELLVANQALAAKMNAKKELTVFISEVGDLLIDCAESFNVYSTYASNYPAAMKAVVSMQTKPEVKEHLAKMAASPESRGLSLESFLIKPIQRICKYPLLIRELDKFSERAGNLKDQALLQTAAEKIETVVKSVNEATRDAEERQRILNIHTSIESPTPLDLEDKVFLKDGVIQRIIGGKPKDRYIVIYTDLILISAPIPRTTRGPPKYELENGYSLAELTMSTTPGKETIKGVKGTTTIILNVITEEKDTIIFTTNTPAESEKWLEVFQTAFRDITEEHRSAVRSMDSQQKSIHHQSSIPEMFGSTRGTKGKGGKSSGLSSIAMRKAASRKSAATMLFNATDAGDPEEVKISGVLFKRALSAFGIPYYYSSATKQSIWKLPADYTLADNESEVGSASSPPEGTSPAFDPEASQQQGDAEEDGIVLGVLEGFSNWRKVERGEGEIPYYFHTGTQETRWEPPTSN